MTKIGVLTSGGDAQGMNAAVRAVVRVAIYHGAEVYAIYEGYQGMIEGGNRIQQMHWYDVGGILHRGGTIIGSARSAEFRTPAGRLKAAYNLLQHGIDKLVVIGGDGSLTGADLFRQEWPFLLETLVEEGKITADVAAKHQDLTIAGLAGSIDNDLCGTDMTIGADSALHRIVSAIDAISSTAASHQRAFVVEVMGRRCGYLALMGAIASGADWVLIPESPPDFDDWEDKMCNVLRNGRLMGRRDSIVVVAEGAQDRYGRPITSDYVRRVLEERLGEDTRVTILGHVQRGGAPSVFDRNLSTLTGSEAINVLLDPARKGGAWLIGMRANRIITIPLKDALDETKQVEIAIKSQQYEKALELRGGSYKQAFRILRTMVRAAPHAPDETKRHLRIAIVHAGAPAPGMNTAVRAAVRLGVDKGHEMLAIRNGFRGLTKGDIKKFDWMSVNGWASLGGAELGTNRYTPSGGDFYEIARNLEKHKIEGLMVIGGWAGYNVALKLYQLRKEFPAFNIPIVCMPVSIDNDLPGCELSIGADTALNCIVDALDKIRQSAVAANRVFVVEVMGRTCGYLALMSALASGAERVYLPEEGVTLRDLQNDLEMLVTAFNQGKRLGLMIRNESANAAYDTAFMVNLFEEEGKDLFDVRQAILGHLQQGGDPTPFDRVQAARQALRCIEFLEKQAPKKYPESACVGLINGRVAYTDFDAMEKEMDWEFDRPKEQWWLGLTELARMLALPAPPQGIN